MPSLPSYLYSSVTNVPTVSDTKRAFYRHHDRPLVAIYRRVVEELLVEMHLLRVNGDFAYDPIYALGIVSTYDRFMAGYLPEADIASIFNALCRANEGDPDQYRRDAEALVAEVTGQSGDALKAVLGKEPSESMATLTATVKAIGDRQRFKYSRAFAIGLYTLVEAVDPALLKDKDALMAWLQAAVAALPLSFDKLQKDVELYRSNLSKMEQAKAVMADILAADRKKREERAQERTASTEVTPAAEPITTPPTEDTEGDSAS